MELLLESIRVEMPFFHIPLLNYHLLRIQKTQLALWNVDNTVEIEAQIEKNFKQLPQSMKDFAVFKCRLIYNKIGIQIIEWHPYQTVELKNLQIIEANHIDYHYKYADRTSIEKLKQKVSADDILMTKNNLITDISYANVAFHDGKRWITPEKPLLKGVKREKLLQDQIIIPAKITSNELKYFNKIRIFNAMTDNEYLMDYNEKLRKLELTKNTPLS
jgi:4-amino-4-deoxychorismate lyase